MSATDHGSDDRVDADFIRSLEGIGWDGEPVGRPDLVVDALAAVSPLRTEGWD